MQLKRVFRLLTETLAEEAGRRSAGEKWAAPGCIRGEDDSRVSVVVKCGRLQEEAGFAGAGVRKSALGRLRLRCPLHVSEDRWVGRQRQGSNVGYRYQVVSRQHRDDI